MSRPTVASKQSVTSTGSGRRWRIGAAAAGLGMSGALALATGAAASTAAPAASRPPGLVGSVGGSYCLDHFGDTFAYAMKDGRVGAEVCFQPSGDILYICDLQSDGHSAWAQIYHKGKYTRYQSPYGSGRCAKLNWNLQEDHTISWQAEVWEGRDYLYQGSWRHGNTSHL